MLSIEEIKKACEFAEGFRVTNGLGLYVPYDNKIHEETYIYYSEFMESIVYYPLFLQRVIEGMNRIGIANIEQLTETMEIQIGISLYCIRYGANIDQAKEEAIRRILGKNND